MKSPLAMLLIGALLGLAAGTASAADPAPAESNTVVSMSQFDLLTRMQRKDSDLVVLDVRTPAEFAAGHVPGARNLSHDLLQSSIESLAPLRDKQVVLYCRSGRRTQLAADVLQKAGFKRLAHLEGDYLAWEAHVERGHPSFSLSHFLAAVTQANHSTKCDSENEGCPPSNSRRS